MKEAALGHITTVIMTRERLQSTVYYLFSGPFLRAIIIVSYQHSIIDSASTIRINLARPSGGFSRDLPEAYGSKSCMSTR